MKTIVQKTTLALIIFFFAFAIITTAQNTQVAVIREWVKHFAEQDSIMESPSTSDGDGNFYVAGYSLDGTTGADIVVAKYTEDGSLIWSDQFYQNSSCYCREQATAITVDANQNVYVTGITFTDSTNGFDYVTIMYDVSGSRLWERYHNGNYAGGYDIPVAVCERDGDIYVTGTSQDSAGLLDIVTIRYKPDGSVDWTTQYDGSASLYDAPRAMRVTSARVIITGASQNSILDWDYLTLQYLLDGTPRDTIIVTNSGNSFDRANAVALTDLGTAYITGRALVTDTDYDIRTIKIDSLGNMIWVADYDYNELVDEATSMDVDADENIYITGYGTAGAGEGEEDYVTIKYDSSGNLQWIKYFNGPGNGKDVAWDIDVDSFGVAYVTGESDMGGNHNFCTIAYQTSDGLLLWKDTYDGLGHCWDKATNVECDSEGIVYVSGQACINDSTYEYVTIRYYSRHVLIPPDSAPCPSSFAFYGNYGQIIDTDDSVRMDIKHYTINHNPSLYFFEPDSSTNYNVLSYVFAHVDEDTATTDTLHRVDLTFENYDGEEYDPITINTPAMPVDKSDQGYLNYFLPQCPDGITGVEGFKRISYPDAFFNTDIQFYGNNSGMKFYIVRKPEGATDIVLKFTGQDSLAVTDSTLEIISNIGSFRYDRPVVFQIDSLGNREEVNWTPEYVDLGNGRVGFVLQSYSNDMPLVIEVGQNAIPETAASVTGNCWYSMYYGDALHDRFFKVYSDPSNNFYTAGETFSAFFPITSGSLVTFNSSGNSEGVLVKFDSIAQRKFATFIGGGAPDNVQGIVTDNVGNIYIVGSTGSADLPISNPGGGAYVDSTLNNGDGFISKLNSTGNILIWSTYYGNNGLEGFYDIQKRFDPNDLTEDFIAVGQGDSLSPVYFQPGDYIDSLNGSGLIVRFSSGGARKWATLFGSKDGLIRRAAVMDVLNDLFITGWADSVNFPIANPGGGAYVDSSFNGGFTDTYVAKFDSSNALVWSTYVGGSGRDYGNDIAISPYYPSSYVAIAGGTESNNFPYNYITGQYIDSTLGATTSFDRDGFIAKFSYNGVQDWATYIGSSSDDEIHALAIDSWKNIYVSGHMFSADFTTQDTTNVFYRNYASGNAETFIAAFRPINTYFWGTYFGGQRADVSRSLYVDDQTGRLFMAGETGSPRVGVSPSSQRYPWVFLPNPSWFQSEVNLGYQDACVAWFDVSTIRLFVYPSVPEISAKECEISIFPNPAENDLYLLLGNDFHSKATVKIYNNLMQIIYDETTDNIMQSFDVSTLAVGMYIVQVTTDKCSALKKIIIQK